MRRKSSPVSPKAVDTGLLPIPGVCGCRGCMRTSLLNQMPAGAAGLLWALSRYWWEDVGVQTRECWLFLQPKVGNKTKTKSRNKYEGTNTLLGEKRFWFYSCLKRKKKKKPLTSENKVHPWIMPSGPVKTGSLFQLCVWLKGNSCSPWTWAARKVLGFPAVYMRKRGGGGKRSLAAAVLEIRAGNRYGPSYFLHLRIYYIPLYLPSMKSIFL